MTRALRMGRIVPRTEEPEAAELRDGMYALQNLFDNWLANGMFGKLSDVYKSTDYTAQEGERVYMDGGTLTLPVTIDNDRKPRDLAAIEYFASGERRAYVWDRNEWVRIDGLLEADTAPLSNRGVNGLAACVARAYVEEFGGQLSGAILLQERNFRSALAFKYGSERDSVTGDWF